MIREEPPGGGPVAAVAAGVSYVHAPWVAVLAGDLPFVTAAVIADLRVAARDADVALLVDGAGVDQLLCAVWRTAALRAALAGRGAGTPMRLVVGAAATVVRRTVALERREGGEGAAPPWFDCDTEDDLARARRWAADLEEECP